MAEYAMAADSLDIYNYNVSKLFIIIVELI